MDPKTSKLFNLVKAGDLQGLKELVEDAEVKKGKRESLLDDEDWQGWTMLHLAALHNHPSIIQWLLYSSEGGGRAAGFTKILAKTVNGSTALHFAAERGHLECCHALVEGSNVDNGERAAMLNAVDGDGWTVLHHAAYFKNSSITKWLLSSEEGGGRAAGFTSVLAKEIKGSTALHFAAEEGHLECCQALVYGSKIDNGEQTELLNAVVEDGWTVLHYAAFYNHPSIIRWLLSSEEGGRAAGFIGVLAKTVNRSTALHIAAEEGHLECFQALVVGSKIENGERAELLNAVVEDGWTVLHFAAFFNRPSIIGWFLSSEEGGGRAVGFINILAKTVNGSTALHFAAERGHLECCRSLVFGSKIDNGERAALLNSADDEGWTVLHVAAYNHQLAVIKWLLSSEGGGRAAGFINILAKTVNGSTALHIAAEEGHLECCRSLVVGSNVENGERAELLNAADKDGWTVLHVAAYNGQPAVVRWLLSSSEGGGRIAGFVSVLAKTVNGATALHFAAEQGHLECCQALVYGSYVDNGERAELLNVVDAEHGWSVLHIAAHFNQLAIVRWLLSSEEGGGRAAGFITVLAKTVNGSTALHLAARQGHLECCQALVFGSKIDNGERAELLNGGDRDGWTVLHVAAYNGQPAVARWFLSSEGGGGRAAGFVSVLAKTVNGSTALHLTAERGHLECCQALVFGTKIDNGERAELLNDADDDGWTVLHFAANYDQPSIIRWLLSSEEGGGRAAGFIRVLAKTVNGSTALHLAAQEGHLECFQALVEGSNVDNGERAELLRGGDRDGWTVLHYAANYAHPSIIQWLISSEEGGGRAAGFTSKDLTTNTVKERESALHLAAYSGSVECLNTLLSGCTVGERLTLFLSVEERGWTVLYYAARWSNSDIIRELLLHYPETQTIVDHRDHRGMTALHRAVIGGVDEESREEWAEEDEENNIGQEDVVAALLTFPEKIEDDKKDGEQQQRSDVEYKKGQKEDEESDQQQAAMMDPNLGTKIE